MNDTQTAPTSTQPALAPLARRTPLLTRIGVALAPAAIALALAIAGGFLQFPTARASSDDISAGQKTAIEKIIRDYLLKNPEVLLEAKEAYDRKAEEQQMATMKKLVAENREALFRTAADPTFGPKDADVTVVEFFDYNCGYCRQAMGDVTKLIATDKKIKFVFKEFPIFGENSEAVSKLALAAHKQGKYWEMHQGLYERKGQDKADPAVALLIARDLGLDVAKLQKDAESPEVLAELTATRNLAEKMGIQGTPHFIIGDNIIPGAPRNLYEMMSEQIAGIRTNGCAVC